MILGDIVQRLSDEERDQLRAELGGNSALTAMLIMKAIENPALTAAAFIREHRTTQSTFNKIHSQAIDVVYDLLKRRLNNGYDPIMLVRKLLLLGLPKQARKLYNELEKAYEREMRYGVLDVLYHEGVRIAYDGGDITWLRELEKQVNENSAKLLEYNRLDKGLACEMLELERGRKKKDARHERVLLRYHSDAVAAGHPVLIINSLYSLHVYYLRHRIDLAKASQALSDIVATAERYSGSLDAYSIAIAAANLVSFLCTYAVDDDPEPYFSRIDRAIGEGGTLGPLVSHFQRFQYYLFTDQDEKALREYEMVAAQKGENRFHPMKSVASAWLAFSRNDRERYAEARSEFYEHPSHRDLPEHEFELRAIDLLLSIRHGDLDDAIYKGEALRKFAERHFHEPRMHDCRRLLQSVTTGTRRRALPASIARSEKSFMLRSMRYLVRQRESGS